MAAGHSKLRTARDARAGHEGRRVAWIDWDSGFRGSGLRVGDRLVGDSGGDYSPEAIDKGAVIGASEGARIGDLGLEAGQAITLHVERQPAIGGPGERLSFTAPLVDNQTTRDAEGRRAFGEDGPAHGEKDGFTYAYSAWYEKFRDLVETVLLGWDYTSGYDTRRLAERLEEHRARVEHLAASYPGAFARAAREDFDAALAMLAGEARELTQADLEYRKLGDVRGAQVSEAADRALAGYLAAAEEAGAGFVDAPFPVPNAFEVDVSELVGRRIRLPEIDDRDLLLEAKRSWYRFGRSQGLYVISRQDPATRPLFRAVDEYIEKVDPNLGRRRLTFFGAIEASPALVCDVRRSQTEVALRVRPLAALVTDHARPEHRLFVDMEAAAGAEEGAEVEAFAGEAALLAVGRPQLRPDLDPAGVMRALFDCLKLGDFDTFLACFATWKVRQHYDRAGSSSYVDLSWVTLNQRDAVGVWDSSRRELLADVYGLEVAAVSEPEVVFDAANEPIAAFDDAPEPATVERVRVLVNHIGRVDGDGDSPQSYRTFAGGKYHRRWTLERLDDGPWRVTSAHPI